MARQALGRGLEMLIPRPAAKEPPASGVTEIPVDAIVPNPYQPRKQFAQAEIDELAGSIRTHGVLQPLVLREVEEGYQCVVGERRLRASRLAGLAAVPALVRDYTDQEMLALALVENAQREDLAPLDSAVAYRRLTEEFGMTQQEVGAAIGKSRSAVANTLRLLDLPDPIRDALAAGEISEGHARAVLTAGDADAMLALWDRIAGSGVSVREVERLARELRHPEAEPAPAVGRTRSPAIQVDPNLAMIVDRVQRSIGTKVTLTPRKNGGSIAIEYYSDDDLERILDLLAGTRVSLLD